MIKNNDFNLLFVGRMITNFGDSLYAIATAVIVYRLTDSTFYSGFALFLTSSMGIVQLLFSPLLDRVNIKKMLIYSQSIQGILLLSIPILHQMGRLTLPLILTIMPLVTLFNQFVYPSQISLLPKILKEEELLKGNILFMMAYQGSDTIFNAIAGLLITILGGYALYYISSISFFINSLVFLFLSKMVADANRSEQEHPFHSVTKYKNDFLEAVTILKNRLIWPILVGIIFINFFATGIYANLPAFAGSELQFSFFMATSGLGLLFGSVLLNIAWIQKRTLVAIYGSSTLVIGLSWVITSYNSRNIWLALFFFLVAWLPVGLINVLSQTMLQLLISKRRIGVVMGATLGISTCLAPFGALVGGVVGSLFNSAFVIAISGVGTILIGLFWLSLKSFRELKTLAFIEQKGIKIDDK